MSNQHRYILAKGPKKFTTCPQCHKREFVRYIDTENNNEPLADHVGRCNRESKCVYHYTPKEHFATTGTGPKQQESDTPTIRRTPQPAPVKTHIPADIVVASMANHNNNSFIKYLLTLFDPVIVQQLIKTYSIGSSNGGKWWKDKENVPSGSKGESAVFWFINKAQHVRYGQVKLFDATGHTTKYWDPRKDGTSSCTTGVYFLIKDTHKKIGRQLPQWLTDYITYGEYEKQIDCFFGEHLLNLPEYAGRPVAVVESPKTCIVASVFFPQYTWLAAGALSYLTPDRCRVLAGKNVVLFPDLGAYDKWSSKAIELKHIANFTTSDILEQIATPEQRAKSWDLCDYIETPQVRRELMEQYKADIVATMEYKPDIPQIIADGLTIFLQYQQRGLRAADAKAAHLELMQEAGAEQSNIIDLSLNVAA